MADLSKFSDAELERIANAQSLAHMSDAELEKLAAGKKSPGIGEYGIDMARSLPGGLTKGVTGIIGLPGTLFNPSETETVEGLGGEPITVNKGAHRGLPTGEGLDRVVSAPFGGYYEPKYLPGKITERAAEFAPAVIGGPASVGTRLMGRVLAPAAGSVAAEDLVKSDNPGVKAGAQITGAVLGAGLYGGTRALSQAVKNAKLTPDEVANSFVANAVKGQQPAIIPGKGQIAAEAYGPTGVANLAALGRRGGSTAQTLANQLKLRAQSAPNRILDDFLQSSGVNPQAARGNFEGLVEAGEKRASPLYREYYDANKNVASPLLDKILETPAGKKALADARVKMQNDMSLMGTPDAELIEQAKEGGSLIPTKGVASGMKARVYDYVKRSLDDQIDAAYRGGNKNEGNIIRDLKNRMVKELDDLDVTGKAGPNSVKPEGGAFKRARGAAGDYLSAKEAYEQGGSDILDLSKDFRDVATEFGKRSETAKEAYKAGIANELFLKAGNQRLNPRLLNTPAVREKLSAVLGPDKAEAFMMKLQQEMDLAASGNRMMPGTGSITSDVLNATKEQDLADTVRGASHFARAAGDIASNRYGSAIANVLRGGYHFAPDMFRTGGMSEEARNAAGKLLMLPPEDFAQQLQALPAPRPSMGAAAIAPYLLRK